MLAIDRGDRVFDRLELLLVLVLEHAQRQRLGTVERRGPVFQQRTPGHQKFREGVNGFVWGRPNIGLWRGAEAGEHGRIDRAGLHAFAGGLGKAAGDRAREGGLQRVGFDTSQTGLAQRLFQCAMIGAGGPEDNAGRLIRFDPTDQLRVAFAMVDKLPDNSVWVDVDIETEFGNIDPDVISSGACATVRFIFSCPMLVIPGVEHPGYPFGPLWKKRGDQTPTRSCPTGMIPIRPLSPSTGCSPSMVNPFASRPEESHKTSMIARSGTFEARRSCDQTQSMIALSGTFKVRESCDQTKS
jgi:hypothetical protein